MLANHAESSQNRNVQLFGFVYHDTNGLNRGPVSKTQLFLLNGICMVILWQDYYGKGSLRNSYCNTVGRKVSKLGMSSSYTVKKGCSHLFMWMTSNWQERIKTLNPMWKVLNKEFDLGEPTSFLDHVYLGCTQRQCEISKDIVDNYRRHVRIANFCVGNRECFHSLKIFVFLHGRMTWWVMQRNVWNDIVSWETRRLDNSTKYVSTPCTDDHHFKEEETKSVGELSQECFQIALKCLNLARIGRPDILWSVNKLARSITEMDQSM